MTQIILQQMSQAVDQLLRKEQADLFMYFGCLLMYSRMNICIFKPHLVLHSLQQTAATPGIVHMQSSEPWEPYLGCSTRDIMLIVPSLD